MTSRVVIPVLENLEQNRKPLVKQVVKGIKQIQEQQINSQSNSATQTTFSFQPPSQNTVIDRSFVLEMDYTLTGATNNFVVDSNGNVIPTAGVAGAIQDTNQTCKFRQTTFRAPCKLVSPAAAAATTLIGKDVAGNAYKVQFGNNFAPRQFPLASCMSSIDLVINGTHFSVSVADYIHAVMKYTTPEWRDTNLSMTQHAPDTISLYNLGGGNDNAGNLNPLNLVEDGFLNGEEPRGAWWSLSSTDVVDASTINFTLREPLFISPLMAMLGHGLTNVNQLDITIRWKPNLVRHLFSGHQADAVFFPLTNNSGVVGDNGAAINDANLSVAPRGNQGGAKLNMRYYTPQDDVDIPNEIVLPYKQPQIERQTLGNLAGANTATGNNIRLNQVPEACYIYIANNRDSGNQESISSTNTFARITGLDIRWKNQTGILSGFTEANLVELAKYNGCDTSLALAAKGGLCLKLNFGQDIPLDDNESPGTRGDYNWQLGSIQYNSDTTSILTDRNLTLYQVFVLNGHAIVSPNECRVSTGVLSLEDNMRADEMGHSYQAYSAEVAGGSMVGGSEVGGSLVGGVAGHLKKVYNVGKHLVDAGKAAAPELKEAVQAYKSRM